MDHPTLAVEVVWDGVTRRIATEDAADIADVLVAICNLLTVNLNAGNLATTSPWARLAGELADALVTAGHGPLLTLTGESMTIGHRTYPRKKKVPDPA